MTTTPTTHEAQQFEQLFQRSHRRAYRLAYLLTGNAAEAEDVTQDAYLRAWNRFHRYDANCSFESWLFRILSNRASDLRRRKRRVQMVALDAPLLGEEGQSFAHLLAAPDSDPQDILLAPLLEEEILRAVATLPDEYRQAFLLRAVEQRSYQEIADQMRCAVGTVRSRIHRARRMLRGYLT